MGSDLYMNPPQEPSKNLSEHVADLENDRDELQVLVNQLEEQLESEKRECVRLRDTIKILKEVN